MNENVGCLSRTGVISAFLVSPAAYFVVMIAAGWHAGVKVGAAFGLLGLILIAIEIILSLNWIAFWTNFAWAAVPMFFLLWGNRVPASEARASSYWIAGIGLGLAGLVWLRRKLNAYLDD